MTRAMQKDVKTKARAVKKPLPMEELLICHENIVRLEGEMSSWKTRYDALLQTIVAGELPWTKTRMQEKKNSKADTYKEGQTAIIRTPSTRRTPRWDEIRKTFPDFIRQHGTAPLNVADKFLGADTVNKYCDTKVSYSYEVQSLKTETERAAT